MTLQLNLPRELETELSQQAAQLGLPLSEYAVRLLSLWRTVERVDFATPAMPKTGAELVAYWQREGLTGTRPDIADSQEHARVIRAKAEHRERTVR